MSVYEKSYRLLSSDVDLNGHMNNTRYLDLAEDRMPADLRARSIREVREEFSGEAKLGEAVTLTYGVQGPPSCSAGTGSGSCSG